MSSAEAQLRFQNVPLLTNDQWSALPSRGRSRPELGVPAGLWRGSPCTTVSLPDFPGSRRWEGANTDAIAARDGRTSPHLVCARPPRLPMLHACGTRT